MEHKPEKLDDYENLKTTWGYNSASELFLDLDLSWEDAQEKIKIDSFKQSLQTLFGLDKVIDYCKFTKEKVQSGEGAGLYTIIDHQGNLKLIKIGIGEFNAKVFNTKGIHELGGFYHSPLPLFVIDECNRPETEDYEDRKKEMYSYLNDNAIIVAPKGGSAYYRNYNDRDNGKQIKFGDINIKDLNESLRITVLKVIEKEFSNGDEFKDMISTIANIKEMGFKGFYLTISNNQKKFIKNKKMFQKVLDTFKSISTIGKSDIGMLSKEDALLLYKLITSFEIEK